MSSPPVIAVTGTRENHPVLPRLLRALFREAPDFGRLLYGAPPVIVTGACLGVDAAAARVACLSGLTVHTVIPAQQALVDPAWPDWCHTHETLPPGTSYRDRDQRMVDLASALVIAVPRYPRDDPRSRRSGTWLTVRLAEAAGLEIAEFVLSEIAEDATQWRLF